MRSSTVLPFAIAASWAASLFFLPRFTSADTTSSDCTSAAASPTCCGRYFSATSAGFRFCFVTTPLAASWSSIFCCVGFDFTFVKCTTSAVDTVLPSPTFPNGRAAAISSGSRPALIYRFSLYGNLVVSNGHQIRLHLEVTSRHSKHRELIAGRGAD